MDIGHTEQWDLQTMLNEGYAEWGKDQTELHLPRRYWSGEDYTTVGNIRVIFDLYANKVGAETTKVQGQAIEGKIYGVPIYKKDKFQEWEQYPSPRGSHIRPCLRAIFKLNVPVLL